MKLYIFVFLTCALGTVSFSQEINLNSINLTDSVPFNATTKRGVLANGLIYYLSKNNDSPGKLLFNFYLKAGYYQEDRDQAEVSHFVEHLVLRRTKHYSNLNSFPNYLNGADIAYNAFTHLDATSFFFEVPVDTSVVSNVCVAIRDWLAGQAILNDSDIDATKDIIEQEANLGGGISPVNRDLNIKLLKPSRYTEISLQSKQLNHRYTSLSNVAIRRFYKDWYRPDLGALVIVGDFDVQAMERVVKKMFGDLINPVNERPHKDYPFVLTGSNRYLTESYSSPQENLFDLNIHYKQEHHPQVRFKDYKRAVMIDLFNDMMRDRLSNLYNERSDYFSVHVAFSKGMIAINSLGIDDLYLKVRGSQLSDIKTGLITLFTEIERLKRHGFSAKELENSRSRVISRSSNFGSLLEESNLYKSHFLYHDAAPSAKVQEQLRLKFVSEITVHDINDQLVEWLIEKNRDITLLVPQSFKSDIPNEALVLAWFRQTQQESVGKYEVKEKPKLKVNFDSLYSIPFPADYTRKDREMGVTQLQLANGVKVVLKKAFSPASNRVYLEGARPVGLSRYSIPAHYLSARLAGGLVLAAGLGELSQKELENYNEIAHLRTSFLMTEAESVLSGDASNEGLEALFQVVYRYFLPPRNDSIAFRLRLNRIKRTSYDFKTPMENELNSLLGYHVRIAREFSKEELSLVNQALCMKTYTEVFSTPKEFTFVLTGIQDMDNAVTLVAKYLGNLPVQKSVEFDRLPTHAVNSTTYFPGVSRTFINKRLPKSMASVCLLFPCVEVVSAREHLCLDFLLKIMEFIAYRRLREEEGGVYTSFLGAQKLDTTFGNVRYEAHLQFDCKPEESERLIHAAMEEITNLKRNGPTTDDLNATRLYVKKYMNDARWSPYLMELYQKSESPVNIPDLEELVDSITLQDIQEAAQKFLSEDCFLRCVEVPEGFKTKGM
jgi:zinc protease